MRACECKHGRSMHTSFVGSCREDGCDCKIFREITDNETIMEGWIVYEIVYSSGCREIRIRNYLDTLIEDQKPMYVTVIKSPQPSEDNG